MMTESLWSVWLLFKSCPLERTCSCLLSSTRCLFSPLKKKKKKKIFPRCSVQGTSRITCRLIKCCQSQRAPRKQSCVCLCVTERRRLWLLPNSRTFRWGYKSRGTLSQVAASVLRRNLTLQWRLLWTAGFFVFCFFFPLWCCCRNLLLTLAVRWSVSLCDSRGAWKRPQRHAVNSYRCTVSWP